MSQPEGTPAVKPAPTPAPSEPARRPTVSLVISVWNRKEDLRENLAAIRQQTHPPDQVVVVDNASEDGTPDMVRREFPEVQLICMPHSRYGACETFNVGFASARGDFVGILDDDVVLPSNFIEDMLHGFEEEPATTVVLSPKVIEPGMPAAYKHRRWRWSPAGGAVTTNSSGWPARSPPAATACFSTTGATPAHRTC